VQPTVSTIAEVEAAIPQSQIGAKAGAIYRGDGLSVTATAHGARLRCVFQRLDAEATHEGLWLISAVSNSAPDRFRVVASQVGCTRGQASPLARTGAVFVQDTTVRFTRPQLVEEYTVSMDGVRQDFVVTQRPAGDGELQVFLDVTGARVEATACGAQLVLEKSGRKIAYGRLRVTDATGRELPARIQVSPAAPALAVVVKDVGAAYPVRIDPTFSDANWISMGGIPGANSIVNAVAVDSQGTLYVAGSFTAVGNIRADRVAKWNGTNWSALGLGLNGTRWRSPERTFLWVDNSQRQGGWRQTGWQSGMETLGSHWVRE
jgi:hypothetical protein